MSYDYIEPLDKKPEVVRKIGGKESVGKKILLEFQKDNKVKYAKVSYSKIKNAYKSPTAAARAIGRISSTMKLSERIDVYSDKENIYLEKK